MVQHTLFIRSLCYYALTSAILTVYGGQVCPFIESLTLGRFGLIISICYGFFFLVRTWMVLKFVVTAPLLSQAARQFFLELSIFFGCGLALTVYNFLVYDFPIESGLRLAVGCVTLGFFLGLDITLFREREVMREVNESGRRLTAGPKIFSLPRRLALGSFAAMMLATVVLMLLVAKDIDWIVQEGYKDLWAARRSVTIDILYVSIILLALILNFIFHYAGNIAMFFDQETRVLESVAGGNLDREVPVTSNDEFGIIAGHTNKMIEGLRERDRIRNVFGKMVSPAVARRILDEKHGLKLGGSRRELVILFSDVRGFTTLSEKSAPETIVEDLNRYFAEMVRIIHSKKGLVDKFIGDGLLAVFGLENNANAVDRAVQAAIGMQQAVIELRGRLSNPVHIGIGIHLGDVIAGNIGSPDRMEYTFIGDTVNTASRLESATKKLNADIIVSETVYQRMNRDLTDHPWIDLGTPALKGKGEPIRVYGLRRG